MKFYVWGYIGINYVISTAGGLYSTAIDNMRSLLSALYSIALSFSDAWCEIYFTLSVISYSLFPIIGSKSSAFRIKSSII